MADDVLVGHANAAVQLHRLLSDKAHGRAELVLGAGHCRTALWCGCVELEAGVIAHGPGQLQLHFHVGSAVAQGLEAANHGTKLLARHQVFGGHGHGFVHHADGFGAGGGNADVHGVL